MSTIDEVQKILQTIPDPELGVSLWDLGLIYDISIDRGGSVRILMTLTTLGCPLFDEIAGSIRKQVGALPKISAVDVDLTFEPPWNSDRMTQTGKEQLGFL
ncbi:MAG: iron-sulfur cluster assembly protein [bacterium]|nr:iron-sulfur cluster assembly protein [bacterium]